MFQENPRSVHLYTYINSLCHFSRGIPEWSKTFISELSSIVYHKQTLTPKFPLASNSTCSKIIGEKKHNLNFESDKVSVCQFAHLWKSETKSTAKFQRIPRVLNILSHHICANTLHMYSVRSNPIQLIKISYNFQDTERELLKIM